MEQTTMVVELIEALISIRDKVGGYLSIEEREALNETCWLLEKNLGLYSRYDHTFTLQYEEE